MARPGRLPWGMPRWLERNHLRTTALWTAWTSLAFVSAYPTCNALADLRTRTWRPMMAFEAHLPFVPVFVWAYVSMYVLFLMPMVVLPTEALARLGRRLVLSTALSALVWILWPTTLGWARTLPADPVQAAVFRGIFALDRPHNLAPSLHVVYSALIVLALARASRSWGARAAWHLWLGLIALSTVLVHQHHVGDVLLGLALAWALHALPSRARA